MKLNSICLNSFKSDARLQSGAVLLVSMIMLLLLTLIGVTGMRVSNLEEKMAGNAKEINLTFQAAETTLRGVENILNSSALPAFLPSEGFYRYNKGVERWQNITWTAVDSQSYSLSLGGVSGPQARYIVEELPPMPPLGGDGPLPSQYYQITTRVVGSNGNAIVVLQAVYKR